MNSLTVGFVFQYKGFRAWWKVVSVVERGVVVERLGDGSHKHFLDRNHFDAVVNVKNETIKEKP